MTSTRTYGTKGADVWEDTGSALLDYSIGAVRGASKETLRKILSVSSEDAFVMAFHVRNIRGGRGERDVFKNTFLILYERYPERTLSMLDLVPHYGCWDDLFDMTKDADTQFTERVLDIAVKQLLEDYTTPLEDAAEKKELSISLCAKWAPRERKKKDTHEMYLVRRLAKKMFPAEGLPRGLARYRRLVADLNRRIKTVETKMNTGHWAEIDPKGVPGRAGKLYSRAFLNLRNSDRSQIRKPGDADRMTCRRNFMAHFQAAAAGRSIVHGASTLFPHEIVEKAMNTDLRQEERDQLAAVWRSMVESIKSVGRGIEDCEIMCDFSGSMRRGIQGDTPFWVSLALGMLVSEITGRNRIMTFDSVPQWHTFPEGGDLFAKVQSISHHLGQGLSTNFQAAYGLLVADVKLNKRPPPKFLLVLTDMNFDKARGSEHGDRHHFQTDTVQTHAEMARETFRRLSEDVGKEYSAPVLGIWNLAANPTDIQATASEEGVVMLSGWSATQFKVLQEKGLRAVTPIELLCIELYAPQYDLVRRRHAEVLD
jgi:hypothetical protein